MHPPRAFRPTDHWPDADQLRTAGMRAVPVVLVAPQHSMAQRLTAHILNVALMLVALPLGVTLTATALLCGSDIRLSAHMVALTGVAFAVASTPLAHAMAATLAATPMAQGLLPLL